MDYVQNCSEYHTFAKLLEVQNVSASASTSVAPVYSCTLSKEKDCFPSQRVSVNLSFKLLSAVLEWTLCSL